MQEEGMVVTVAVAVRAEGLLLVGANERNLRCGLGLRLAPRDERRGRRAEAVARGAEG